MTITVWPVDAVTGAPSFTGQMARQAMSVFAGAAPAGRPLGAVSGVRPGTPAGTVSATSSTWTCLPHSGILDTEASAVAGPYQYAVGATVTGSVTAANATNPRIDIVYAQLSDPAAGDGTTNPGVAILYLAGTAAPSPVPPATPARSMVLAQINVPVSGGGSPTTTWVAPLTTAAGAIVPCPNSTTYPTSPYVGQYVDDASLGGLLRWNGTLWSPITTDTGWITITSLQSGWTAGTGGNAPQVRQIGNEVVFQGNISDSIFSTSTFQLAASIPAGIGLPLGTRLFPIAGPVARQCRLTAGATDLQFTAASGSALAFGLDVISYRTN